MGNNIDRLWWHFRCMWGLSKHKKNADTMEESIYASINTDDGDIDALWGDEEMSCPSIEYVVKSKAGPRSDIHSCGNSCRDREGILRRAFKDFPFFDTHKMYCTDRQYFEKICAAACIVWWCPPRPEHVCKACFGVTCRHCTELKAIPDAKKYDEKPSRHMGPTGSTFHENKYMCAPR